MKIKVYAQFYQYGVMTGKLCEACGDRAVIILDGRETNESHNRIAREECVKRGYVGYKVLPADSRGKFQKMDFNPSNVVMV